MKKDGIVSIKSKGDNSNEKKIISTILLISTLFVGGVLPTYAEGYEYTATSSFNDVSESDWFYDAVSKVQDANIIKGYGDGNFGPNDPIKMNQMILIVYRAYLSIIYGNPYVEDMSIPGDSFQTEDSITVFNAAWMGIIPDEDYTGEIPRVGLGQESKYNTYREEALSCLYRAITSEYHGEYNVLRRMNDAFDKMGISREIVENPSIPDYEEISDIFKNDIYEAYRLGIARGYDETGLFKPKNEITRAEFCQMMVESGIVEYIHLKNNGLI